MFSGCCFASCRLFSFCRFFFVACGIGTGMCVPIRNDTLTGILCQRFGFGTTMIVASLDASLLHERSRLPSFFAKGRLSLSSKGITLFAVFSGDSQTSVILSAGYMFSQLPVFGFFSGAQWTSHLLRPCTTPELFLGIDGASSNIFFTKHFFDSCVTFPACWYCVTLSEFVFFSVVEPSSLHPISSDLIPS